MVKANEVMGEFIPGPQPMGEAVVSFHVNGQPAGTEILPDPNIKPAEASNKVGKTVINIDNLIILTNTETGDK